jgi:hypothetical protein
MSGTKGLYEEFGPRRIREAPISESAMVGAAVGAAMFGQRPIVEIAFGEFLPIAMSQIVLQAANAHYMTAGEATVPIVIRTRIGDGPYRGHPQCYEAWFPHVPGARGRRPAGRGGDRDRGDRSPFPGPARSRDDRWIGPEDQPTNRRARGVEDRWIRRRDLRRGRRIRARRIGRAHRASRRAAHAGPVVALIARAVLAQ